MLHSDRHLRVALVSSGAAYRCFRCPAISSSEQTTSKHQRFKGSLQGRSNIIEGELMTGNVLYCFQIPQCELAYYHHLDAKLYS